ncbi:hypothetical protein Taro_040395 [Colocasia esculenta]|uniref:GDSL esterase/lipase n=1 Tax=Colocasia esculenta TaxID=4460 RepID=A0A843WLS7_COLES|nr:hypothetical protein [Colocasia esculenta]
MKQGKYIKSGAKQYGFKQSPPAFLSLTESRLKRSICEGINFASGAAGILPTTGTPFGEVIPMDVQLDNFRSSLKSFTARRCSKARRALLSKSVFLVSIGSNDLFTLYNSNTSAKTNHTTSKFITALASKYRRQLRTLYRLGARRFAILGLGKLGCCPSLRILMASEECVAALDDYAFQFNVALRKVLEEFSSKQEGIKYSFGDVHNFGKMLEGNPLAYGFKEIKVACCGGGRLNGEVACTPNATLCSNRDDYCFWDWYHLSDNADKLLARLLFGGPPALASPIKFGDLVG